MTTAPEPWLTEALRAHRDRFDYLYQGWLSDHGPMAILALVGLGSDRHTVEAYAARYQEKLDPLPPATTTIERSNYAEHIGSRSAYPALLQFFDREIQAHGWEAAVARYWPPLASGWVKDAVHATIRLAYGVEFSIDCEVAAGLAYLSVIGPDPALAAAAEIAPAHTQGALLKADPERQLEDGIFNHRYRQAVASPQFREQLAVPADALATLPREALGVFASTHDFFALHLVTGTHAFSVLAPFLDTPEPLLAAGLLAAYMALDQPNWVAPVNNQTQLEVGQVLPTTDEHDIKLAHSCRVHAKTLNAPVFETVAATYLNGRLA